MDMGCSPSFAASVCSMLDGDVVLPTGNPREETNPKPPPPKGGRKNHNQNATPGSTNEQGPDNKTPDPPTKKARPAKPQVSRFIQNTFLMANNIKNFRLVYVRLP